MRRTGSDAAPKAPAAPPPRGGAQPAWGGPALAGSQFGFTLVELIVSITLLSTLAMVAVPMLRMPMAAYLESHARVSVVGELDDVQSRLTADLARALPNSVRLRTVGARQLLEFLDLRAEGRHRGGTSGAPQACPAVCAAAANNDALEAACTERCFTSLGPAVGDVPVPGADYVVVNPLGPGVPNGDPYFGGAAAVAGGIKTRLTASAAVAGGTRFDIAPHNFPALASSRRFFILSGPVSYECNPGSQSLLRHDSYAIRAVQPVNFGGAQTATLASGVTACRFAYTRTSARGGVVTLWLRFTRPVSAGAPPEFAELVLMAPVNEA